MQTKSYRPDIDGLRAAAVLAVLFYHAGFASVSGGFVGVDVFLVISGFLISGRIYAALSVPGVTFRAFILHFYEARARRILPAYAVVSIATLAAGYFIFLPDPFVWLAQSALASAAFSANIYFWFTQDYFAPAAETLPLLHYWSLGLEEHFYVAFPLLAFALWRFGIRIVASVLAILFVSSLALSFLVLEWSPPAGYYLLPFRAWELLIGSMLALPFIHRPRHLAIGTAATLAGLVLILWSVFAYTDDIDFPGIAALMPCLGAGLVIWGGGNANLASRLVGAWPMVRIGLISYSLYLIHWPVIVFARELMPDAPQWRHQTIAILLSLVLAEASYRFVEIPTRRANWFKPVQRIAGLSAAAIAIPSVAALFVISTDGFPARLPQDVRQVLAYRFDATGPYREGTCFLKQNLTYKQIAPECLPTGENVVLLWGDSHAAQYVPGLKPALEKNGLQLAQITSGGCPPFVGTRFTRLPNCRQMNDFAGTWALKKKPRLVILSARWNVHKLDTTNLTRLQATIKRLAKDGIPTVVLGPSPSFRAPVPYLLAEQLLVGDRSLSVPYFDKLKQTDRILETTVKDTALYLSPIRIICPTGACLLSDGKTPYYFDISHFTDAGSRRATEMILPPILKHLSD
jgi:peptidoglycan/LPS O-acetylase OafA/YrhL